MGKVTGFLEFERQEPRFQPASDRIRHFREFTFHPGDSELRDQASRCMDCAVPYCHTGCPLNNQIPDWNEFVHNESWLEALNDLHSTNNFPEFTGRTCPAPCEPACTLDLVDAPVTIKQIEDAIARKGWEMGWIQPQLPKSSTGKTVGIVGSGPAGLAAAQQLARRGHAVTIFDREPRPGGLLRYGIPDFKMEKHLIDRRMTQLFAEGVVFRGGLEIGSDMSADALRNDFHAVLIACGAEAVREPGIEGSGTIGVHYAMPFLVQQNRRNGGETTIPEPLISAAGKHVVVIGGGDTASDCIGTAFRQGAISVVQIDIRPRAPDREDKSLEWPDWPVRFRVSTSQAEGASREFSTGTLRFVARHGMLSGVGCTRVDENRQPVAESDFLIPAELALIAIGFSGVRAQPMLEQLGASMTRSATFAADDTNYQTDVSGVFAAGDARRGQSLVVWSIQEGRGAARAIDRFLCS